MLFALLRTLYIQFLLFRCVIRPPPGLSFRFEAFPPCDNALLHNGDHPARLAATLSTIMRSNNLPVHLFHLTLASLLVSIVYFIVPP